MVLQRTDGPAPSVPPEQLSAGAAPACVVTHPANAKEANGPFLSRELAALASLRQGTDQVCTAGPRRRS